MIQSSGTILKERSFAAENVFYVSSDSPPFPNDDAFTQMSQMMSFEGDSTLTVQGTTDS
jgi:hypothetical protein